MAVLVNFISARIVTKNDEQCIAPREFVKITTNYQNLLNYDLFEESNKIVYEIKINDKKKTNNQIIKY